MRRRPTARRADRTAYLARYLLFLDRVTRRAGTQAAREILLALAQRPYAVPRALRKLPTSAPLVHALTALAAERRRTGADASLDAQVRALVGERLTRSAAPGRAEPLAHSEFRRLPEPQALVHKPTRGPGIVEFADERTARTQVAKAKRASAAKRPPRPAAAKRGAKRGVARERAEPPVSVELQRDIVVGHPIKLKRPAAARPPGTLGGHHEETTASGPSGPPRPPAKRRRGRNGDGDASRPRWVNAEIENHETSEPLEPDTTYQIAFSVNTARHVKAVATTEFDDNLVFAEGVREVVLTVQLDSDDFKIPERTRPLRVPRSGQSRGSARFDITPLRTGRCSLHATIHKQGNFIQKLDIAVSVGPIKAQPVAVQATGRPPVAAAVLQPRDIGLTLEPAAAGGYTCTVRGPVAARAHLPIQQGELTAAVDAVQAKLLEVVTQSDDAGTLVFQTAIDIPEPSADTALRTLARAGALLFQSLFYHPAAGADAKRLGAWLRAMATNRKQQLTIQVVTLTTPIPWDLIYVGDAGDTAVLDWDHFLGMRHIVEQIPLQNTLSIADSRIASDEPSLAISVNVNSDIDKQFGVTYVKDQTKYWKTAAAERRLRVKSRNTSQELLRALGDDTTDDQIVYFYCHASTVGIGPGTGGPNTSTLELTDREISLADLKLNAPTTVQLRGMPLVFINACESAELSPAFYDGFVPYFMAKGARGVVGTECQTPALFAARWHDRFFDAFLGGAPIGETFLTLRREFLDKHHNPLGLLYAVHCDADTQIHPAVAASTR